MKNFFETFKKNCFRNWENFSDEELKEIMKEDDKDGNVYIGMMIFWWFNDFCKYLMGLICDINDKEI